MTRQRLIQLVAIAALFTLFATACGSTGTTAVESGAEGAAEGAAAEADQADGADSVPAAEPADDGDPTTGPITELLGFGGSEQEQNERFLAEEREVEQYVAGCMAEQGFEYIPVDPAQYAFFGDGSDEFGEQYGYGISTTFEEEFSDFGDEVPTNPNDAILANMSEAEADAYSDALWGPTPEFDPTIDTSEDAGDFGFEIGGCYGEAYEQTSQGQFEEFFTEFSAEFEALEARYQADPRIAAAHLEWSTCMGEAGFTFSTPDEVYEVLISEMNPFYEDVFGPPIAFSDDGADVDIAVDPGVDGEHEFVVPTLDAEAQATLDEIQARELAIYAADQSCQGDLEEIAAQVQLELEQEFFDANEARITELLSE